jgi:hypothetical protein
MSPDQIAALAISVLSIAASIAAILAGGSVFIRALAKWTESRATKMTADAAITAAQAKSIESDVEARKLIMAVATGQIANATRIQELEKGNQEQLDRIKVLLEKVSSLETALDAAKVQLTTVNEQLLIANQQLAAANTQMTRLILIGDIAAKPDDTTAAHAEHAANTAIDNAAKAPAPIEEVPVSPLVVNGPVVTV